MQYYKIDHVKTFKAGEFTYRKVDESTINPAISKELFFVAKQDLSRYKVGKRVRIGAIGKDEAYKGKVIATENGAPTQVLLDSGQIIAIFGMIIELLPLLERIIEAVKQLFKKD